MTSKALLEKAPLITPDDLPSDLLKALSHEEIERVGYYLFPQLSKQRDADHKHYTGKEVTS